MKSSQEDLHRRGLATSTQIEELSVLSPTQLLESLHSDNAATRTAAAYNLSVRQEGIAEVMLKQLQEEKCLYTKIAICESLEKGDINTSRQMIEYLGKIGDNQHKTLPDTVSKKKSYPLPRDIIARSLGRMEVSVFPALMKVLQSKDTMKIAEVLDAVGYMVFYHPQLATIQNAKAIIELTKYYPENNIILWKVMMCLSAFGLAESKELLLRFSCDDTVIGMEAKRSLNILKNH